MRPGGVILAGAIVLSAARLARAQDSTTADPCKAPKTQFQVDRCANDALRAAEAKLNRTYTRLLARSDSVRRALLREDQRTWILFRGTHCRFAAVEYEGGVMFPARYAACLTEMTDARDLQLRDAAKEK